jgi:hypothetical protein
MMSVGQRNTNDGEVIRETHVTLYVKCPIVSTNLTRPQSFTSPQCVSTLLFLNGINRREDVNRRNFCNFSTPTPFIHLSSVNNVIT